MTSTRVLSLSDSEAAQRSSQEMQSKDDKDEDKGESRGKFTHTLFLRASEWTTVVSSIWVETVSVTGCSPGHQCVEPALDRCMHVYIYLLMCESAYSHSSTVTS